MDFVALIKLRWCTRTTTWGFQTKSLDLLMIKTLE